MNVFGKAICALGIYLIAEAALGTQQPVASVGRANSQIAVASSVGFSVSDDIGVSRFTDAFETQLSASPQKYSPDGRYFAVVTEHGAVDKDSVEDTLWLFSVSEVKSYMAAPTQPGGRSIGIALVTMSVKEGFAISHLEWLKDSSGLAFVSMNKFGKRQLFETGVDGATKAISQEGQDVTAYDVQGDVVAYSALTDAFSQEKQQKDGRHLPSQC
jgi:hypothetical protein